MGLYVKVLKNQYIDSVTLMLMSTNAGSIDGVQEIIIAMGTDMNKEVMKNVGLFNKDVEQALTSDLIITAKIDSAYNAEEVFAEVEELLFSEKEVEESDNSTTPPITISAAVKKNPEANLALISVNGQYAGREALQAINNNLNVMIFSDNVDVDYENKLKQLAHEKGLLVMGPDCGTAIINNVGLGFSNKVRSGNIGIIGASGTGSQEVSVRIHEFGGGVSQLIGTGGRDLSTEIGGQTMLDALDLLALDPETEVILLVSKKPAKEVEEKIVEKAKTITKPVVTWFIGTEEEKVDGNVHYEVMSKNASLKAVELAGIDLTGVNKKVLNLPLIEEVKEKLGSEQKYIRGLFTGGTLCQEAVELTEHYYDDVYSNVTDNPSRQLKDIEKSTKHTFIDFGTDEFTDGKPHPMIDPSTRIERFVREAKDPEVGVIALDFVLGYGSHEDPVGVMVPYIEKAIADAKAEGRHLEILGYVLGTELDEQNLEEQIRKLINAGATHSSSSQNTGLLARGFV